tara:strand:+ start:586 stop:1131 length:546 start_codon:yes stop_codon:yes gene_type:complete
MDKFIKTYDNVVDDKTCHAIMGIFDSCSSQERVDNDGRPTFTQVNLNSLPDYKTFTQLLTYKFIDIMKDYKKEYPEYSEWWPHKLFFEQLRVKKYEPDSEDFFNLHVDVQDHPSAKRYLAFLLYLNHGFDGGATKFPYHNVSVAPEMGKVLVFPPTWQYPHMGLPVSGKPKYIMSTYLHYY